ncbi:trafficking protein particle complex 2 [Malassezia pachydermatis]|uniref:Trafficking protein particle complex 2 n=1 Tax=Malassezia pachydermatis TaxID=77020 RepID=A0A0M8MIT6_9BASI|nr:trafficking protein particle complex 2 [Malassezia pachydermatis]KOS13316.1 trafficking protein particle complex 2 [Malassezia pachydermatis]
MLDERLSQSTSPYLGLLLSVEDTAIYGFQTSTQLKILLMLEQSTHDVPDKDISDMFRAIHAVYMSYMSNPFVNMGADDLPPNASMDTPRRPTVPPFASGKDMPVQNGLFDKRISAITGWTVPTTSDV